MNSDQNQPISNKSDSSSGRPKPLGRGLDALLPSSGLGEAIRRIPVSQIGPNPYQTRTHFDPERLKELAESIKLHGVLQPIVVRKSGDRFLLIAGERRWRATALAGVPTIPVIVKDVPESEVMELTLIENIQREDLNPIEAAEAFSRLANEFNLTHEQIATRTGKDRATVSNFLRLLRLPTEIKDQVASGKISMGHARALLGIPTEALQVSLADRIIREGLSVRETESLVQAQPDSGNKTSRKPTKAATTDPNIQAALQELERTLGTRVKLVGKNSRGKLVIEFYSAEDLERIYEAIVERK